MYQSRTLYSLAILAIASTAPAQSSGLKSDFTRQSAAISRFEIESGRLAVERSVNEATRAFARDTLREHTRMLADLGDAAVQDGTGGDLSARGEYADRLSALKTASESDFDQAYLSAQVIVYEQAMRLFQTYGNDGQPGALRNFAENQRGTLHTYSVRIEGLTSD
jgi:putative membrane protein